MLESDDVADFLTGLAQQAAQSLSKGGGEVLCGVTLLRERQAATVASSSARARYMDEIQYNFGDGPCLTASREQLTISVPDLRREDRWPDYADAVLQHGIRSVLAVPFDLADEARAALNLYSTRWDNFTDHDIELAEGIVAQTSKALRLVVRFAARTETATHLKSAMESRTTIDLAVGIIMAQNRCSQGEAVEILKSASSSRNIKLRDIAATLVNSISPEAANTHFDH
ncbi:GAF and ANTAR domain-containing protein [Paenarthrobacter sp. Z7-10]|uniref:GAF and ANTAR domain-containing protein n=1 Tax=Paenarthrobacter sp. Z7-10 TaxID=2787635 RepID=UPI0022A909E7|nr:GAF and ANTAR domain-containing protein [Paenarthrobacter sp. Z7-10]